LHRICLLISGNLPEGSLPPQAASRAAGEHWHRSFPPFPAVRAFRPRPDRRRAYADDGPVNLPLICRRRPARANQISSVDTCRRRIPTCRQGKVKARADIVRSAASFRWRSKRYGERQDVAGLKPFDLLIDGCRFSTGIGKDRAGMGPISPCAAINARVVDGTPAPIERTRNLARSTGPHDHPPRRMRAAFFGSWASRLKTSVTPRPP